MLTRRDQPWRIHHGQPRHIRGNLRLAGEPDLLRHGATPLWNGVLHDVHGRRHRPVDLPRQYQLLVHPVLLVRRRSRSQHQPHRQYVELYLRRHRCLQHRHLEGRQGAFQDRGRAQLPGGHRTLHARHVLLQRRGAVWCCDRHHRAANLYRLRPHTHRAAAGVPGHHPPRPGVCRGVVAEGHRRHLHHAYQEGCPRHARQGLPADL